jgi:hypothetical protein
MKIFVVQTIVGEVNPGLEGIHGLCPDAYTCTLSLAFISDLIQRGKDAHGLTGCHLTRGSVMNVIRKSREIGKMRRVILTCDQLVVGIGPVIAVGDYRDLTSGRALHLIGKLELAAIGQREPNT